MNHRDNAIASLTSGQYQQSQHAGWHCTAIMQSCLFRFGRDWVAIMHLCNLRVDKDQLRSRLRPTLLCRFEVAFHVKLHCVDFPARLW